MDDFWYFFIMGGTVTILAFGALLLDRYFVMKQRKRRALATANGSQHRISTKQQ